MLHARFGYLPGAAILSLAFSGSAGIINSGRKGLKALHTDKGILTSEECSECASKVQDWYSLASIVIVTQTTDVVQRTLDVVRQQFPSGGYHLKEFAELLQGRPKLQLSLRYKEYA